MGSKVREGIGCPFCVSFYWATALTAYVWGVFGVIDWRMGLIIQPAVWRDGSVRQTGPRYFLDDGWSLSIEPDC